MACALGAMLPLTAASAQAPASRGSAPPAAAEDAAAPPASGPQGAGSERPQKAARMTALTLNGRAISAGEYAATLRLLGAPPPRSLSPAERRNEAERFLNFASLVAAGERDGIEDTPEFQRRMEARRKQILEQMIYQKLRRRAAAITPDMARTYYDQHRDEFVQARLERIYFPNNASDPAAAGRLAAELEKRAAAGASLASLAANLPAEEEPGQATDIGLHQPGTLGLSPANERVVFALRPGELSPVLQEATGYFLFRMVARQPTPPGEALAQSRNRLFQERLQKELADLRGQLRVEWNDAYFDLPARANSARPRAEGNAGGEGSDAGGGTDGGAGARP